MKYENEEQIRKDFARLFGWRKERGQFDYTTEYRTPEWSKIFSQIGKLLQAKDNEFFDSKLLILQDQVSHLEQKLNLD